MFIKPCIIFLVYIVCKVMAVITIVEIGVLPLVENSVGITFFVDVTNEDRQNASNLYSRCKKCCFIESSEEKEDCDVTVAFGDDIQIVKPRDRKTLLYVSPMLFQHDLVGYCNFVLLYDHNNTKEEIDVTIPFNTQAAGETSEELMYSYIGSKKRMLCSSLDEDSLNNCEQVDCSVKYLDKKPTFDRFSNKCVEAPKCLTNPDKELPDYVYISYSNTCRNLDLPLTVQDIYAISTGLGTVTMPPDLIYETKIKVKSNCFTISQNLNFLCDLMKGKMCPLDNEVNLDYGECFESAVRTVAICIIYICGILVLLVCCVNGTFWLYVQWSRGNLGKLWQDYKKPFKGRKSKNNKKDKIHNTLRNALLREVIVKDIPLELRDSAIDVCDRMEREVRRKKRHGETNVGSNIGIQKSRESLASLISTSTSIDYDKG